ncbi:MAG: hypothetical protein MZV63_53775 [Marinilabiliales bacterium]|nr:hypothetical protein [Marinilabiliales bacterium]
MKKLATSVIIMLFTIAAMAQEEVPLTKQEKKALKQEQKKQNEAIMVNTTYRSTQIRPVRSQG